MTDYGQDLEFGIFPSPAADRLPHILELAQLADVLGLDVVSVQDHPYQGRFADTWTLLTAIGVRTNQVKVSPNVANLPLRQPVVLAKSAATLDLLTGGRVELGLGAGAFWDAIVAAGGQRRTPKEAVDALTEAIAVIRAVWSGGTVREAGEHYPVKGLHGGPVPAHDIPIWLGSYKPRMLRLTGAVADGWVPSMGYADPPDLPALAAILDEAALEAGRDPVQVRRIYNVNGSFGRGSGFLQGSADQWAEDLAGLTMETGMSTYILGTDDEDVVRRFAEEVAPATRDLVARERERQAVAGSVRTSVGDRTDHGERTSVRTYVRPDDGSPNGRPLGRQPLQVTPTADGQRHGQVPWDESARPSLVVDPEATYDPHGQASAQHLVDIHDGLRAELAQVRAIVDQVRAGHLQVGAARSVINTMTMRQNNWTLGAYCEAYCRIVTGHHTLEDRSVFTHLRAADPDLAPVLDRLHEEHEVIHDVLDRLDRALVALVGDDGYGRAGTTAIDELSTRVDELTDTLLSHLSYEERELLHPLARHGLS